MCSCLGGSSSSKNLTSASWVASTAVQVATYSGAGVVSSGLSGMNAPLNAQPNTVFQALAVPGGPVDGLVAECQTEHLLPVAGPLFLACQSLDQPVQVLGCVEDL